MTEDLPKDHDPRNVHMGINFHLVPERRVVVVAAEKVSDDFHARFSARGRSYLYRIVNRPARLSPHLGRPELFPSTDRRTAC